MSLKKIEQVREDKGFKIFDLIIYGVLAALIIVLFIVFVFTVDKNDLRGVNVRISNDVVFTYSFENNKYDVINSQIVEVVSESDDELVIRLNFDNDGYNDITINKAEVWVKVTAANCSMRKDCVYTSAISNDSSMIVCAPRGLFIVPYNYTIRPDGTFDM
jgi:hypothetical protein